jgi:hypothetical protein
MKALAEAGNHFSFKASEPAISRQADTVHPGPALGRGQALAVPPGRARG